MNEQQQENKEMDYTAYSEIKMRAVGDMAEVQGRVGEGFVRLDIRRMPHQADNTAAERAGIILTIAEAEKLASFIRALAAHGKLLNKPKR